VPPTEIVITGVGVVSPIGIGRDAFWEGLCQGRSGVGPIGTFDASALPVRIAAQVRDFDPKAFVTARKSLKVMSRDAQLGVAATALACRDARLGPGSVDPDRFGIVLGAARICTEMYDSECSYRASMVDHHFDFGRWGDAGIKATFPLSFLRVLPNMTASHISIIQDARGPNNTIHQMDVSSLLAIDEAAQVIRRGWADVMIAGAASSEVHPFDCVRRCVLGMLSPRQDDPAAVMRPFDADRDGQVWGEGAAVFILERRAHADARGAEVLARYLGSAVTCEPLPRSGRIGGSGLRRAMTAALERAGLDPKNLGHVNAHGLSAPWEDRLEAQAICDALPGVPVTAPKSYFGNLGAASGAVEMAVSVLAMAAGEVPPTLNYERPDPDCPIPVVRGEPLRSAPPTALTLNWTPAGQSVAVVLGS
jgi:3-oxoacyl-[acyl-carrier-protein] synthase II